MYFLNWVTVLAGNKTFFHGNAFVFPNEVYSYAIDINLFVYLYYVHIEKLYLNE